MRRWSELGSIPPVTLLIIAVIMAVITIIPAAIPGIAPTVVSPAIVPAVVTPAAVPTAVPAAGAKYCSASAVPKIFDGSHTDACSQHRSYIIFHEISKAVAAGSMTIVTAVIGVITIAINWAINTTIVTAASIEAASWLYVVTIVSLKLHALS